MLPFSTDVFKKIELSFEISVLSKCQTGAAVSLFIDPLFFVKDLGAPLCGNKTAWDLLIDAFTREQTLLNCEKRSKILWTGLGLGYSSKVEKRVR